MPAYGPYAGTKFALEAVSDSLRRELAPLGVRVVIVEPGAVRTEMSDRVIAATNQQAAAMSPEQRDRYGTLIQAVNAHAAAHIPNGRSAADAARVIAKAVTRRKAAHPLHRGRRRGPDHPPIAGTTRPDARPHTRVQPPSVLPDDHHCMNRMRAKQLPTMLVPDRHGQDRQPNRGPVAPRPQPIAIPADQAACRNGKLHSLDRTVNSRAIT